MKNFGVSVSQIKQRCDKYALAYIEHLEKLLKEAKKPQKIDIEQIAKVILPFMPK